MDNLSWRRYCNFNKCLISLKVGDCRKIGSKLFLRFEVDGKRTVGLVQSGSHRHLIEI